MAATILDRRAATAVERPGRRDELHRPAPAAFRGGRALRGLAAAAVVDEAWNQWSVAGRRTRARPRVFRLGEARSRIHRQLVACARPANLVVDGTGGGLSLGGGFWGGTLLLALLLAPPGLRAGEEAG